jgi:hypothetical protein
MSALSTDCKMGIWSCERLLTFQEDLTELKADRVIKSKHRLTCLAINNLPKQKSKDKGVLGKRTKEDQEANESDNSDELEYPDEPDEGGEDELSE